MLYIFLCIGFLSILAVIYFLFVHELISIFVSSVFCHNTTRCYKHGCIFRIHCTRPLGRLSGKEIS